MSNTMRVYISVNVQTQSKWAFTQIKMPGWYRRRLVTLFMDSIQVCSVWHDIKTAGRSSEGRERRQTGGGRWRLERTCVWELSVIHTLLTTTQLCSTQSLGHFTERRGLWALWVFAREFKKTSCESTTARFACLSLTNRGFNRSFPEREKQVKEKSAAHPNESIKNKTMLHEFSFPLWHRSSEPGHN